MYVASPTPWSDTRVLNPVNGGRLRHTHIYIKFVAQPIP